ncbi:MAG: 2,3-bisphosphoglycerate-independent phosphoglycerate mutase [archaeon]
MSLMLIVLDGWGLRTEKKGNAVLKAKTPFFNYLLKKNSYTQLKASAEAVGLPKGYMGNSEVGHLHLGAGRLVEQDLIRVNTAIKNKSFFKNKILKEAFKKTKEEKTQLHLMGLLSDAGVHSHIDHLFALIQAAKKEGIKEVYVHAFLDGRDTPPKSAKKYIEKLEHQLKKIGVGQIGTITGRYYAMDRDNRWTREKQAYDAMVGMKGKMFDTALEALEHSYSVGETDEFVTPKIIKGYRPVMAKDTIIFFNFRSDRARETTKAFTQRKFSWFKRNYVPHLNFVCMTQYDEKLNVPVMFEPINLTETLGEILSKNGIKQLRVAETEKYAHVTFFFNGLSGKIFDNEERIIVPSPKVKTYDMTPKMSAKEIMYQVLDEAKKYNFVLINFANADMVGHTGDIKATVEAIETVDQCLKKIVTKFNKWDFVITADHGNAEEMDGKYKTSHTLNPVPCIIVSNKKFKLKQGSIYNVAPTILELMNLKKPEIMSDSLIK